MLRRAARCTASAAVALLQPPLDRAVSLFCSDLAKLRIYTVNAGSAKGEQNVLTGTFRLKSRLS